MDGFLVPPSVPLSIGRLGIFEFVDEAVNISGYIASNDMTVNEECIYSDVTTTHNDII
jgi:hypothetical protein